MNRYIQGPVVVYVTRQPCKYLAETSSSILRQKVQTTTTFRYFLQTGDSIKMQTNVKKSDSSHFCIISRSVCIDYLKSVRCSGTVGLTAFSI